MAIGNVSIMLSKPFIYYCYFLTHMNTFSDSTFESEHYRISDNSLN